MAESTRSRKSAAVARDFVDVLEDMIVKLAANSYCSRNNVVYEVTDDPAIISQYYAICGGMYRNIAMADRWTWCSSDYSKLSRLVVARRGKICLGGVMLTIREADEAWALPIERLGFAIKDLLPELALDKVRHGQIFGFSIMEDCAEEAIAEEIISGIFRTALEVAAAEKVSYVVTQSAYNLARRWQSCGTISDKLNAIATTSINRELPNLEIEDGEYVRWFLTVSDLTALNIAANNKSDNKSGDRYFSQQRDDNEISVNKNITENAAELAELA